MPGFGFGARCGFNEAAAHHRGERCLKPTDRGLLFCFNEAAAHHRGEHGHARLRLRRQVRLQ